MWILAQADSQTPSGITSAPVTGEEETTTTTTVASDPNAPGVVSAPKSPISPLIMFGLIGVMMYFLLFRGPRKKKQQHKQMVQTLEKNDKIRTIGGIIGTVVEVRDDEIVLKVDESNNTKIRIAPSAVGMNMSKDNK